METEKTEDLVNFTEVYAQAEGLSTGFWYIDISISICLLILGLGLVFYFNKMCRRKFGYTIISFKFFKKTVLGVLIITFAAGMFDASQSDPHVNDIFTVALMCTGLYLLVSPVFHAIRNSSFLYWISANIVLIMSFLLFVASTLYGIKAMSTVIYAAVIYLMVGVVYLIGLKMLLSGGGPPVRHEVTADQWREKQIEDQNRQAIIEADRNDRNSYF